MHDHLARQVGRQRLAARRWAARLWRGVRLGALGGGRDLFAALRLKILELQFELVDVAVQPLGRLPVTLAPEHRELHLDPFDLEQRRGQPGLEQSGLGAFGLAGDDDGVASANSRRRASICCSGETVSVMPVTYPIRATCTSPDQHHGTDRPGQTTRSGVAVHAVARQSINSSSMDICAMVNDTTPSLACGQMKRPRSSFLA